MARSDGPRFVLASASPRRRELLTSVGASFAVEPADADETPPPGATPEHAAVAIAERKARAAAARTDLPVLAADTLVVAADGGLLGKPASASEAAAMLRRIAGTAHRVVTGVCLLAADRSRVRRTASVTHVTMRTLSEAEIAAYAGSGEPFGKAGGYAIQERGDRFVVRVEGSRTNVVGLPLDEVSALLRAEGLLA